MVSNLEGATLSNARKDTQKQHPNAFISTNDDGLTIICTLYSFYEPFFKSKTRKIGGELLLFS